MATSTKNILLGFGLGWSQITLRDSQEVRDKIMAALKINNRASFCNYRTGRQRVTFEQANEIEKIFKEYGVRKIWGKFPE